MIRPTAHDVPERDVPFQPAVGRGAEQPADRRRRGDQPEAERAQAQPLPGVQHEHRPGRAEGDVEGEDGDGQRPDRGVRPQPAPSLADVLAHPGRPAPRPRAAARSGRHRIRAISSTPASTHTASVTKGRAIPAANSAAPTGGPASWLPHDHAGECAGVRDAEVARADQHRQHGGGRGLAEGLVHPEQEQRGQHHRDVDPCR